MNLPDVSSRADNKVAMTTLAPAVVIFLLWWPVLRQRYIPAEAIERAGTILNVGPFKENDAPPSPPPAFRLAIFEERGNTARAWRWDVRRLACNRIWERQGME